MRSQGTTWTTAAMLATTLIGGEFAIAAEASAGRGNRVGTPSRRASAATSGSALERIGALLDSIVPAELAATRTPGAAVAIVIGERVAYAKGFGVASTESQLPVTPDMLFRIASTTKMLTAAAVLAASAQGSLTLDSPVGKVLPGLAPSIGHLTLRDLLRHRAGLREGSSYYGPLDDSALLDFVRSWSDTMLFTEPGDVYSYSNLGYALAGAVLAEGSGRPYADAMRDLLFLPLGMRRSTLRPTEAMTFPLVQGHELDADGKAAVVRPFSNDVRFWPAGSVFTSASEFARFVIAVLNHGRLDGVQALPRPVVDTLLARQTEMPGNAPGERAGYAFGLVVRELRGVRMYQHGGVRIGFGTLVRIIPKHRIGIVILANRTNALLMNTLERATELLVPAPDSTRAITTTPEPFSAAEIDRAVGRYVNTPGELELELMTRDGLLWLRNPQSSGTEVAVTKAPDGRYRAGGQSFAFTTGRSGQTRYLVIAGHALRKR
jgi:CubicO group peptidase (beta-lactamase class C family)